jgi:predicted metal-dependent hydrolase
MNAPSHFPSDGETPAIVVRDSRFGRGRAMARWWCNGDPVATAWMNALSATFPRGEAMFIEAVKAFRDGAPPRLEAEIRAFVRQEVNHTREHVAFNKAAAESGYDLSRIDARVDGLIALARSRPPLAQLAVTMALEHFTAMFAHEFLKRPHAMFDPGVEQADIWRWHAVEEIEHKGVAYDTWLHATRHWGRWKRWRTKALTMLLVTRNFVRNRTTDALDLLAQDGITGWRARRLLFGYLFGKPGVLRRIFPAWLAYFLPGFHPWNRDDRALIARYEEHERELVK